MCKNIQRGTAKKTIINLSKTSEICPPFFFFFCFCAFMCVLFCFRQVGWVIYNNMLCYQKAFSATSWLKYQNIIKTILKPKPSYFTFYFIVPFYSGKYSAQNNNLTNKHDLCNLALEYLSLERNQSRTVLSAGETDLGSLHK